MISAATGNSISSTSIMCYFQGNMMDSSTELISLDPKEIPCECEIIIYSRFSINKLSVIDVDKSKLFFFTYYVPVCTYIIFKPSFGII